MKENLHFEELLKNLSKKEYVGLGNPNAKILFIGKEAGAKFEDEMFHGSVKSWQMKESNYSKRYIPKEPKIRNLNHTWQRYQKLYESILLNLSIEFQKSDKYEITFIENIFTTELSNLHAPNTISAKKQEHFDEELKLRKLNFLSSKFIESFQIVIIFASDSKYIETYPGEVCELFKVKFSKLHNPTAKDKIWIHTEQEIGKKPKLLIHTRQLTNRITSELIPNISNIIVDFMKTNSIQFENY